MGHHKVKQHAFAEQALEDVTHQLRRDFDIRNDPPSFNDFTSTGGVKSVQRGVCLGMNFAGVVAVAVIEALHTSAARGVVFGHRHFHPSAVGEFLGLLHEPFSKRLFSHHDASVQILDRSSHNFAG